MAQLDLKTAQDFIAASDRLAAAMDRHTAAMDRHTAALKTRGSGPRHQPPRSIPESARIVPPAPVAPDAWSILMPSPPPPPSGEPVWDTTNTASPLRERLERAATPAPAPTPAPADKTGKPSWLDRVIKTLG